MRLNITKNSSPLTVPLTEAATVAFQAAIDNPIRPPETDQEVAAISGHKSMQKLKRYTHLRAEDLVGKLDRLHS